QDVVSLEASRLVPLEGASYRLLRWLSTVVLLFVALAIVWPTGLRRGWAELRFPLRWQDRLRTSKEPIVADLKVLLEYPAYTGLSPREFPDSSGHVVALPGTRVKLEGRALARGEAKLLLEEEQSPSDPQPVTQVLDGQFDNQGRLHAQFDAKRRG